MANILYAFEKNDKSTLMKFIFQLLQNANGKNLDLEYLKQSVTRFNKSENLNIQDSNDKELVDSLMLYTNRVGIDRNGGIFANGVFFPLILNQNWLQNLLPLYFEMMNFLEEQLQLGKIDDKTNIYDYFLELDNVFASRNRLIFPQDKILKFECLDQLPDFIYNTATNEIAPISILIIADFLKSESLQTAINALEATVLVFNFRILLQMCVYILLIIL
jgi:hypothetical protein